MPDNARAPWEKPYIPPTPADVWQQAAERGHRALSGGETPPRTDTTPHWRFSPATPRPTTSGAS